MGHLKLPFSASGFWLRPVFPIAFCHQKKFIDFFYLKANQLYLLVLTESRLFKVSLAEVLAAFNDLLLAAVPESAGLTVALVVVLSAERLSVVLSEALLLLLQAVASNTHAIKNKFFIIELFGSPKLA